MSNLNVLLKLKAEKVKFVVTQDNGQVAPLTTGAKGTVSNLDDSILKTLFNEFPLSDANALMFQQLKKVRVEIPKSKKEKVEKK